MSLSGVSPDDIASIVRDAVRKAHSHASLVQNPLSPEALFYSLPANALKQEILLTGRKLWTRQYVDGNGGNISARLTDRYVLCTPTLISKGDLTVEDICLVDLDNVRVCGERSQTSEILLHLEIYKRVPHARAVVHCHPPYATAHAIAGVAPPQHLLPEQEVFIGPVAIAPYDTPGTAAFAQSILPFVETHRTLLLANHGLVSWADTVTHAEWAVEVLETYCKTAHLARMLNPALLAIPSEKLSDLLAVKRQLGIPDPRFADQPTPCAPSASPPVSPSATPAGADPATERLIESLTRQILDHIAAQPAERKLEA